MDKWNALTLLELLAENEKNTAALYREIASNAAIGDKFFENLAKDEERHENIYGALAKRYQEQNPEAAAALITPENTAFLETLTASNAIARGPELIKKAEKAKDKYAVYDIAIEAEKEAVLFATELANLYPDLAPEEVKIIIKEEKKHLQQVTERKISAGMGGLRM